MTIEAHKNLLWKRLQSIHDRVQKLAELEAKSAHVGGPAATQGLFLADKERLIGQADAVLDQLELLYARPQRSPASSTGSLSLDNDKWEKFERNLPRNSRDRKGA